MVNSGGNGTTQPVGSGATVIFIYTVRRVFGDALALALAETGYASVVRNPATAAADRDQHARLAIVDATYRDARSLVAALRAVDTRLVLVDLEESRASLQQWRWAEACGYITMSASLQEFVLLLERVLAGEVVCSASVGALLLALPEERIAPAWSGLYTRRELEVIELIQLGYSNKQIARELTVEVSTVKNHVHRILRKAGVTRRAELAAVCQRASNGGSLRPDLDPIESIV